MVNDPHPSRPRPDLLGAGLSSVALFPIVFGSAKAQTARWGAAITVACLVCGVALLGVFLAVEARVGVALVPVRILCSRARGAAYLAQLLGNAALFAVFLFLTQYLQQALGYSPVTTGIAFLPLMVSIGVAASVIQGKLLPRLGVRAIPAGGFVPAAVGAALLTRAHRQRLRGWVLPGLVLMGRGFGSAVVVAITIGSVADHAACEVARAGEGRRSLTIYAACTGCSSTRSCVLASEVLVP